MSGASGPPRVGRGQSIVEFALVLPVFILIVVGIFDVGRAIFAANTLNNAAREAGRMATVNQTVADIEREAIDHAISLDLTADDISVTFFSTSGGVGSGCSLVGAPRANECSAQVILTYDYQAVTPLIEDLVGDVVLKGETQARIESGCIDGAGRDCPLGGEDDPPSP